MHLEGVIQKSQRRIAVFCAQKKWKKKPRKQGPTRNRGKRGLRERKELEQPPGTRRRKGSRTFGAIFFYYLRERSPLSLHKAGEEGRRRPPPKREEAKISRNSLSVAKGRGRGNDLLWTRVSLALNGE